MTVINDSSDVIIMFTMLVCIVSFLMNIAFTLKHRQMPLATIGMLRAIIIIYAIVVYYLQLVDIIPHAGGVSFGAPIVASLLIISDAFIVISW